MVVPFGLIAMGILLAYSGMKNKSVLETLRGLPSSAAGQPYEADLRASAGASAGIGGKTSDSSSSDTSGTHGKARIGKPGEYVHPFPSGMWTTGRIDQGQDFAPKRDNAPIYAIGDGIVIKTGAPGWPGGAGGVLYKLTNGSMAGKYVFVYESLTPVVKRGQRITAGQLIARGHTGGTGIEIGFADASGVPLSHAGYTEGKQTTWGKRMADFLSSLLHKTQGPSVRHPSGGR